MSLQGTLLIEKTKELFLSKDDANTIPMALAFITYLFCEDKLDNYLVLDLSPNEYDETMHYHQ